MTTTPIQPVANTPAVVVEESSPTAEPPHDRHPQQELAHQLPTTSARQVLRQLIAFTCAFACLTAFVWHHRGPVSIDRFLLHGYVPRPHTGVFTIASIVTDLAAPAAVAVLGAAIASYLWRYRHDTPRALVCLGAPLTAGAAEATLKIVVERLRPATGILTGETGFGFPSGHTAGFAALALAVALTAGRERFRFIALALAASVAIAITRVIVGAHYPTDVIGGLLVGIAVSVPSTLIRAHLDLRMRPDGKHR